MSALPGAVDVQRQRRGVDRAGGRVRNAEAHHHGVRGRGDDELDVLAGGVEGDRAAAGRLRLERVVGVAGADHRAVGGRGLGFDVYVRQRRARAAGGRRRAGRHDRDRRGRRGHQQAGRDAGENSVPCPSEHALLTFDWTRWGRGWGRGLGGAVGTRWGRRGDAEDRQNGRCVGRDAGRHKGCRCGIRLQGDRNPTDISAQYLNLSLEVSRLMPQDFQSLAAGRWVGRLTRQ